MKRYRLCFAVISLIALIALSGCNSGGGDYDDFAFTDMLEEPGINVETAYPVVRTISQSGSYIGTVETGEKVSVTPRVSGYVKEKYYGLGDTVNAGDVLFTIDDSALQLEKKKAEADVRDANAALAKDKAENEATKFEVNETLYTLDTKTQENYNTIQKAIRSEYEARLDLYKACEEESIHKKEGKYIEDLIAQDKEGAESAKEFVEELNGFKSIFTSIKSAADHNAAQTIAVNNGVAAADIPAASTPAEIADIYLNKKTMYRNENELDKAIASSEEAAAGGALAQHEASKRSNDLAIISDEVSAEKAKDSIASAQEDLALKRRVAADYEIYTKAKIWAASQAKLAAGDASVLSANVRLSKAQIDLEIADRKLQYTSVTSPVSGEIVECKVEDFGAVSESGVAYTIIDTSKKKAVFYVTGDAKNNMMLGQIVTIDKSGEKFNAVVDQISDTPDEKRLLYRVSAVLDESDKASFDAGSTIRLITSIKKRENAYTIPIGVVYYDEGRAFVYVARNGVAVKTNIETGIDDATDIEVVSGLSANDQVIVNWSQQLQDKAAVNVTKTSGSPGENPAPAGQISEGTTDTEMPAADTESADAVPESEKTVYVETTSNVNIRRDPTTDSERLETAQKGTRFLKAEDEPGGWTAIIYNDQKAYIKSEYVRECEE